MKTRFGITSYAVVFFTTLALLFGGYFGVFPQTVSAHDDDDNDDTNFTIPPCAFTPQLGRTIVNFPKTKLKQGNLSLAPVPVSLPSGNYKVSLMAWDGYDGRKKDHEDDEQFYVTFQDASGDIANSSVTDDLVDGVEAAVFAGVVDVKRTLSRDATKVVAKHAKLYGAYSADSFFAVCAAFDRVPIPSTPTPSPTPTPTPTPTTPTPKQCADGLDNDGDGKIDSADPACHSDGNPNNGTTYDPNRDTENSIPVITRLGNNPVTMFEGDTYTDAGATAFDEEDGSITAQIVRGGATVTSATTKGNYTITYNVADSKGAAAAEVKRLVIVQEKLGSGCPQCGGGGTVDDPLYISNEKIVTVPSGVVAVITWDTTVSATSQVVFGTTSVKTLTLNENIGYTTSTPLFASTTKVHSVMIENLLPNTVYYFRPISKRDAGTLERAVGIELSTKLSPVTLPTTPMPVSAPVQPPRQQGSVCSEYLHGFIKFGANNDRVEVLKLQSFLRTFEGFKNVPLSGTYDAVTRDAVNVFQDRYTNTILSTWGLKKHTGYVYITTKRHINTIYCGYKQDFPLTSAQKAEIEAYKAQIEKMRAQGIDVSRAGLDNVSETARFIKDKPEQGTPSEGEATSAVIEAFDEMLARDGGAASGTLSVNEANAGKIAKIAAAVSAKIHPSKLIQLFLIIVLFIVGFLLYRSGSKQNDDEDDDSDIPSFGKPYVSSTPAASTPVKNDFEKKEPQKSVPLQREEQKQQSFPQKPAATASRPAPVPEKSRITLDQLKDNLVLKREENVAKKNPAVEENVIQL